MRDAVSEMSHHDEADYIVVNDDFGRALTDLQSILRGNRLRREVQTARHRELIRELLSE
jgi:guanylate kinase